MKALNEKEQNEMFVKFTILYLLSLVVIIIAVFFNVLSSKKELTTLREKLSSVTMNSDGTSPVIQKADSISSNLFINYTNADQQSLDLQKDMTLRLIYDLNTNADSTTLQGKLIARLGNSYKQHYSLLSQFLSMKGKLDANQNSLNMANENLKNLKEKLNTAYDKLKANGIDP